MPFPLQILFAALLGLAFGSFGTMLLDRLPKGETFMGRSRCPYCLRTLETVDLVPVFSFLFLKGRCRSCGGHISWRYPLLEALTALVSAVLFMQFHGEPLLLLFLGIASYMLLLIAFYDFASQRIPDVLVAILFLAALGASSLWGIADPLAFRDAFIGAAIPFIFFGGLWLISAGKWIGSGDILLGTSLGLLLGVAETITALFLAYTIGAVLTSLLILMGKVGEPRTSPHGTVQGRSHTIAFGPFLSCGALTSLFFGERLIMEYQRLLL